MKKTIFFTLLLILIIQCGQKTKQKDLYKMKGVIGYRDENNLQQIKFTNDSFYVSNSEEAVFIGLKRHSLKYYKDFQDLEYGDVAFYDPSGKEIKLEEMSEKKRSEITEKLRPIIDSLENTK